MKGIKEKTEGALLRELSRRDFWEFCLFYDPEFFERREFLREIARAFQEIEEGKINSLSVSLPPRAGKSYMTSLFCAWTLGKHPRESIMRNTCTATLYLKFSYDVRNIFKSDRFREIFSKIHLSEDKSNLNGWNTNSAKMVSYFGAGVGGSIIGFGASKIAITDDLYRGLEDALSDTINDRIIQWKEATHDSRLESGCKVIDIGTRWSINDVIGRNIDSGIYDKSIIVPALNSEDQSFCGDVMTSEEYIKKRERLPREIWLAEYQQEPIDLEGRLFSGIDIISEEEFKKISDKLEGSVGYIDVADEGKDYLALSIGGIIGDRVYILETLFSRDNTDITIPKCAAMLDKWDVKYCRVESNAMGAMFARNLRSLTKTKILPIHNKTNKNTRIIMNSAFILNTMSFVERKDPNYYQFMENLSSYSKEGKNKHDDAPDCISGLAMFMQGMFKNLRQ